MAKNCCTFTLGIELNTSESMHLGDGVQDLDVGGICV